MFVCQIRLGAFRLYVVRKQNSELPVGKVLVYQYLYLPVTSLPTNQWLIIVDRYSIKENLLRKIHLIVSKERFQLAIQAQNEQDQFMRT